MKRLGVLLLGSALALLPLLDPLPAFAQQAPALGNVVANCGTPNGTYTAGQNRPVTEDTTGTLCTASGGGGGGNVNLTGINGVAPAVGNGTTNTGTLRVTVSSDSTGQVKVVGPTANGSPAANPPVLMGGTADGTATGAVGNAKVDSSGNIYSNATIVGPLGTQTLNNSVAVTTGDGNSVTLGAKADAATCATNNTGMACLRQIDADIKGTGNVQGVTASGASLTENPLANGCRAATAAPTAVTDGQKVNALCGVEGKQVVLPYSIKELAVRGTVTSTDTAAHSIIASAGGSLKNYITALQCGRTDAGASAIVLTFSDAASTVEILPAGGATNIQFPIPLATAAATAFSVTSGTGVSTLYCSAQGYTGL